MRFEFIVFCILGDDADIPSLLLDLLAAALQEQFVESEEESIKQMVELTHLRVGDELVGLYGQAANCRIVGFNIDLSEVEAPHLVIEEFATSLLNTDFIVHMAKFDDPVLMKELCEYARDIFHLEMKLRRVLSFIYLHAYQEGNLYDLLREEQTKPVTPQLKDQQMSAAYENQFFHMSFAEYAKLNRRPSMNSTSLQEAILASRDYDDLRNEIERHPIEDELGASLLSDLKELMDPIEQMRNCVAHNRRPSNRIRENYLTARPRLEERMNTYLSNLLWPSEHETL